MEIKKMESAIFVSLLLACSLLALQFRQALTGPKTIVVPDDYSKIQEAVDAAEAGDIIFVRTGVYEERVAVNKNNLTLIGENAEETIIDGGGEGTVLYISANHTTVRGFTIKNSGMRPDSALFLDHTCNSIVWGNILQNYYAGIRIYGSFQCQILGNDVKNGSVGIWVEESSLVSICGNNIIENDDGIRIYGSEKCTVFGNSFDSNSMYGVEIYQSSSNVLSGNNIINNGVGIKLYASSHNKIFSNNFINNTIQAGLPYQSFNNVWDNAYPAGGNYWSDYAGVDEKSGPGQDQPGSDGIGDTPYIIDAANKDRYPLMTPYTPPVQNLNTGLRYPTIQDAIDAATTFSGHTILIRAGIYPEKLKVYKSLTLRGQDVETTIIDGGGYGEILQITTDNVSILNFTIRGGSTGVSISKCSNVNVQNIKVTGNVRGIELSSSYNCTLRNNNITGNTYNLFVVGYTLKHYIHNIDASNLINEKPVYYLIGQKNLIIDATTFPNIGYLAIVNSSYITLENLTFERNGQGVLLAYTTNSTIKKISATSNIRGIELFKSSDCSVIGNNLTYNSYGILLRNSSRNYLHENQVRYCIEGILLDDSGPYNIVFNNNVSENQDGLILSVSSYNLIIKNIASGNEIGIVLFLSKGNTISQNIIADNKGLGVFVLGATGNQIYYNSFINNKAQVATDGSANTWDNGYPFGGNFWSDYDGVDEKMGAAQNIPSYSDGLGDTRYIKWGITDRYPLMKPYGGSRDIGITKITASKTYIPYNYNQTINLNIKIMNYGQQTETFNCTAYYDSVLIDELCISLPSRGPIQINSMIVSIPWDTTGLTLGNYTITANVTILPNEEDTVDNTCKIWVKVVIPGNINGDNIVDMSDVGIILRAYGTKKGGPNWNPNLDINGDNIVDMSDVGITLRNYGKTEP